MTRLFVCPLHKIGKIDTLCVNSWRECCKIEVTRRIPRITIRNTILLPLGEAFEEVCVCRSTPRQIPVKLADY